MKKHDIIFILFFLIITVGFAITILIVDFNNTLLKEVQNKYQRSACLR